MVERKIAHGRVALPGDGFEGTILPPIQATEQRYLQDFYGSDGTRTRDLRRDRPAF